MVHPGRYLTRISIMKKKICLILFVGVIISAASAQSDPTGNYSDFPIIITLQFHCFSLPFRDMKSNFSNIGIGLGTEVSLNNSNTLFQQINAVWYHNKAMGNGLLFYSQSAWRPTLGSNGYSEIKLGAGYLLSFRPIKSFKQVNGNWVNAGHKGKGMFTVPLGVSIGTISNSSTAYLSTFASYQFLLISGYNKSIPMVPETLLQVGTSYHSK